VVTACSPWAGSSTLAGGRHVAFGAEALFQRTRTSLAEAVEFTHWRRFSPPPSVVPRELAARCCTSPVGTPERTVTANSEEIEPAVPQVGVVRTTTK
jgi:hypothetical protein